MKSEKNFNTVGVKLLARFHLSRLYAFVLLFLDEDQDANFCHVKMNQKRIWLITITIAKCFQGVWCCAQI